MIVVFAPFFFRILALKLRLMSNENYQARAKLSSATFKGDAKARLHRRFLSQQLNAIFFCAEVANLSENRTCKPAAISVRF